MKHLLFTVVIFSFSQFCGFSQQKQENNMMKKALIMIDIQNDYFENGSMTLVGAEEASLNARKVLDIFRSEGLPVIYIQHLATSPKATFFLPQKVGVKFLEIIKQQPTKK